MDKESLSNYGWVVICIIIIAILIGMATPFASTIRKNVTGTVGGLQDVGNGVLDTMGKAESFDDVTGENWSGQGVKLPAPTLKVSGDNLVITDTAGKATEYVIYQNGELLATVTATPPETTYTLPALESGSYELRAKSVAAGYGDSDYASVTFEKVNLSHAGVIPEGGRLLAYAGSCPQCGTGMSPSSYEVCVRCDVPFHTGESACYMCGGTELKGNPVTCSSCSLSFSVSGEDVEYKAGDNFPAIRNGMVYYYEDYVYHYKKGATGEAYSTWYVSLNLDVTNKKQKTYSDILESIAGCPVFKIDSLFSGCTSLETAPRIPNTVVSMRGTFSGCSALVNVTLPESITIVDGESQHYMFEYYKDGTLAIDMSNTFKKCTSLVVAPSLPDYPVLLSATFENCSNLSTYADAPAGTAEGDFSNYKIAENSIIDNAFQYCGKITTLPQ